MATTRELGQLRISIHTQLGTVINDLNRLNEALRTFTQKAATLQTDISKAFGPLSKLAPQELMKQVFGAGFDASIKALGQNMGNLSESMKTAQKGQKELAQGAKIAEERFKTLLKTVAEGGTTYASWGRSTSTAFGTARRSGELYEAYLDRLKAKAPAMFKGGPATVPPTPLIHGGYPPEMAPFDRSEDARTRRFIDGIRESRRQFDLFRQEEAAATRAKIEADRVARQAYWEKVVNAPLPVSAKPLATPSFMGPPMFKEALTEWNKVAQADFQRGLNAQVKALDAQAKAATRASQGVGHLTRGVRGLLSLPTTGNLFHRLFGNFGESMETALAVLVRFQSARAIIMGVVNSIRMMAMAGVELEDNMRQVQAITGAADEEIARLTIAVREMGRETIISASEAAKGLQILAQAGLTVNEQLSALPAVFALAVGGVTGIGDAAKLMTSTLRAFNLESKRADDIANVFTATVNKSRATVEDINVAFNYAGTTAAAVGLQFEDLAAITGTLADNGVRASTQGTAVRMAIGALMEPTARTEAIFAKLGISLADVNPMMNDIVDVLKLLREKGFGASEAFASFDRRAAASIAILIEQVDALEKMRNEVIGTDAAYAAMAKRQESLSAQLILLTNRFKDLGIAVGSDVIPILREAVQLFSSFVKLLAESDATRGAIEGVGVGLLIAGLIKGLVSLIARIRLAHAATLAMVAVLHTWGLSLPVVGTAAMAVRTSLATMAAQAAATTGAVGLLTRATNALKLALTALWVRMLAHPLLLLVAGFAALGAVIVSYRSKLERAKLAEDDRIRTITETAKLTDKLVTRYETYTTAIDKATEGTHEHNRALVSAQKAMIDLVLHYPDLLQYIDEETQLFKQGTETVLNRLKRQPVLDEIARLQAQLKTLRTQREAAVGLAGAEGSWLAAAGFSGASQLVEGIDAEIQQVQERLKQLKTENRAILSDTAQEAEKSTKKIIRTLIERGDLKGALAEALRVWNVGAQELVKLLDLPAEAAQRLRAELVDLIQTEAGLSFETFKKSYEGIMKEEFPAHFASNARRIINNMTAMGDAAKNLQARLMSAGEKSSDQMDAEIAKLKARLHYHQLTLDLIRKGVPDEQARQEARAQELRDNIRDLEEQRKKRLEEIGLGAAVAGRRDDVSMEFERKIEVARLKYEVFISESSTRMEKKADQFDAARVRADAKALSDALLALGRVEDAVDARYEAEIAIAQRTWHGVALAEKLKELAVWKTNEVRKETLKLLTTEEKLAKKTYEEEQSARSEELQHYLKMIDLRAQLAITQGAPRAQTEAAAARLAILAQIRAAEIDIAAATAEQARAEAERVEATILLEKKTEEMKGVTGEQRQELQKVVNTQQAGIIKATESVRARRDELVTLHNTTDELKLQLKLVREAGDVYLDFGNIAETAIESIIKKLRTKEGKWKDIWKNVWTSFEDQATKAFAKVLTEKLGFDRQFNANIFKLGEGTKNTLGGAFESVLGWVTKMFPAATSEYDQMMKNWAARNNVKLESSPTTGGAGVASGLLGNMGLILTSLVSVVQSFSAVMKQAQSVNKATYGQGTNFRTMSLLNTALATAGGAIGGGVIGGAGIGAGIGLAGGPIGAVVGAVIGAAVTAAVSQAISSSLATALTKGVTAAVGKGLTQEGLDKTVRDKFWNSFGGILLTVLNPIGGILSRLLGPQSWLVDPAAILGFTIPDIEKIFDKLLRERLKPTATKAGFVLGGPELVGPRAEAIKSEMFGPGKLASRDVRTLLDLVSPMIGAGNVPERMARWYTLIVNNVANLAKAGEDVQRIIYKIVRAVTDSSFTKGMLWIDKLFRPDIHTRTAQFRTQINLLVRSFQEFQPNINLERLAEIATGAGAGFFKNEAALRKSIRTVKASIKELFSAETFEVGFTNFGNAMAQAFSEKFVKSITKNLIVTGPIGVILSDLFRVMTRGMHQALKKGGLSEENQAAMEARLLRAGKATAAYLAEIKGGLQRLFEMAKEVQELIENALKTPLQRAAEWSQYFSQITNALEQTVVAIHSFTQAAIDSTIRLRQKIFEAEGGEGQAPGTRQFGLAGLFLQQRAYETQVSALGPAARASFLEGIESSVDAWLQAATQGIEDFYKKAIEIATQARDVFKEAKQILIGMRLQRPDLNPAEKLGLIAKEIEAQKQLMLTGTPEEQLEAMKELLRLYQQQGQLAADALDPAGPQYRALMAANERGVSAITQQAEAMGLDLEQLEEQQAEDIRVVKEQAAGFYKWILDRLPQAQAEQAQEAGERLKKLIKAITGDENGSLPEVLLKLRLATLKELKEWAEQIGVIQATEGGVEPPPAEEAEGQYASGVIEGVPERITPQGLPLKGTPAYKQAKGILGQDQQILLTDLFRAFRLGYARLYQGQDEDKLALANVLKNIFEQYMGSIQNVFPALVGFDDVVRLIVWYKNAWHKLIGDTSTLEGAHWLKSDLMVPRMMKGFWTAFKTVVPGMAEGGIVTRETLARLGEGGHPEVVLPLDKIARMYAIMQQTLATSQVRNQMMSNQAGTLLNGNSQTTLNIQPGAIVISVPKDQLANTEKLSRNLMRQLEHEIRFGRLGPAVRERGRAA